MHRLPFQFATARVAALSALAASAIVGACDRRQSAPSPPPPPAPAAEQPTPPLSPPDPAASGSAQRLAFPTGDPESSFLLVESIPSTSEVRVGQSYPYQIRVSNTSRHLILEDVTIHQSAPETFEVIDSTPPLQGAGAGASGGSRGDDVWRLGLLAPGQTTVISAVGLTEAEGALDTCIRVTFTPVLCTTVAVAAPALRLVKSAPEAWSLCELIPITYTLTNAGAEPTDAITVRDPLPEGFVGPEGTGDIVVRMEPIAPGESREERVLIRATRAGELAGRAVATTGTGDEVLSGRTRTIVQQPVLALDISGPRAEYTNAAMAYTFAVTNSGNAAAADTRIQVRLDPEVEILDPPGLSIGDGFAIVPLDPIAPGATGRGVLTVVRRTPGMVRIAAEVLAPCARAADGKRAAAATFASTVLGTTSLQLEVTDNPDPVRVGAEAVYEITVVNQGSAPDGNIQLVATLPQGLQLIEAIGPTDAQAGANLVRFAALQELAPGDSVTWYIRATALAAGDVRLGVEVTSRGLSKPLSENEPTRIY
jgi:uncharacterized repeat protein (TIGR01451 family)